LKTTILRVGITVACLLILPLSIARAYWWSATYTVNVSVWPRYSQGTNAWVTLYGNNGYYGHLQTNSRLDSTHTVSFSNVPGGSGTYNRIDVDLDDGTHKEYYNQRIYNAWDSSVNFTYNPQ